MYSSYRMLATLAFALAAGTVQAHEGWSGKLGLGAIGTSGNSQTSTFNVDLGVGFDRGISHSNFVASALQARSEVTDSNGSMQKQTTTERYTAALRTALDFSEQDYVFVQLEFEKDFFGGVRERMVETIGYGRRVVRTETQELDLELGVGARQLTPQGVGAMRESDAVVRSGLRYSWQMTEASRFSQWISVEAGEENVYTESTTELKLAVIGGVFANLGFKLKHNSVVPPETQQTDSISSVSLSYEF